MSAWFHFENWNAPARLGSEPFQLELITSSYWYFEGKPFWLPLKLNFDNCGSLSSGFFMQLSILWGETIYNRWQSSFSHSYYVHFIFNGRTTLLLLARTLHSDLSSQFVASKNEKFLNFFISKCQSIRLIRFPWISTVILQFLSIFVDFRNLESVFVNFWMDFFIWDHCDVHCTDSRFHLVRKRAQNGEGEGPRFIDQKEQKTRS